MSQQKQSKEPAKNTDRVEQLEGLVVKLCALVGQTNLPREFQLTTWSPTKEDMKRKGL